MNANGKLILAEQELCPRSNKGGQSQTCHYQMSGVKKKQYFKLLH